MELKLFLIVSLLHRDETAVSKFIIFARGAVRHLTIVVLVENAVQLFQLQVYVTYVCQMSIIK